MEKQDLLRVYRSMKTIREFEERLHLEIQTGEIAGFTHLYSGQEASAVGVCDALSKDDYIVSTHRGHGHCIAKGCDVKGMMLEIYGRAGGLCKGKGGSMHIADFDVGMMGANAIVGGGPPLAVGAAIAAGIDGNGNVAVAFGGDGSSNQGTVFEAMNLAVVLKAPALFVFENNGYGEHTGDEYAVGAESIQARSAAFGMLSLAADGNDFFDVYEKTAQALEHARAGRGPVSLELQTQRYFGHFEGDPQKYRAAGEVEKARQEDDCLLRFRARVTGDGSLTEAELDAVDAEVLALIDEAVAEARQAPAPTPDDVLTDVYVSY
ncbi:MAG: thiamine pyrophosphate-dependent dehydrogenase E1 component subunit alpha [Xanthomonadales bacterium]|nr:thiamine pyrophosphate-dependent dehydrogenase E1 component subunit alpha [Xanthomonadales bacterium]